MSNRGATETEHEERMRTDPDYARNFKIGRAIAYPFAWALGFLGHAALKGVAAKIEEKVEGKRK